MEITLKKLSEFTGERSGEIVGELLPYVGQIATSIKKEDMESAGNDFAALGLMVKNAPGAFLGIVKALSAEPLDTEQMGAGDTAQAIFQLAADKDFLRLFGYQSKTAPSSGSATETTEGTPSEDLSSIAAHG